VPVPNPVASISRSNTVVPDQQSERGAADLKDATTKVEEVKPVEPVPVTPQEEPQPEAAAPSDDKPKEENPDTKPTDEAAAIPALPDNEVKQGFFPSWLRGMFGQSNKLSNDWESQTLEAYIIPENSQGILKVPFGHQSLAQGLRRMKKQCLPWDQYTALGSQHHKRINQAVIDAKRLDARERTCVAVGLNKEFGSERIMLFFLVGSPVEPIHLKDAVGRKYSFPFEQARTWTASLPLTYTDLY
jgi:Ubiquitin-like domain